MKRLGELFDAFLEGPLYPILAVLALLVYLQGHLK
jgi:hypothetical protein